MSAPATTAKARLDAREITARQGLRLPALTLKNLRTAGIYCQPSISIEYQNLAKKHVLRGVESGGGTADLGAYSSFVDENGNPLGWLQRIDSIGVNGVHAVVIASSFVRLELVRIQRTYDLLITSHGLASEGKRQRPQLQSDVLFFGRRGSLEMELWGKDAAYQGSVVPVFYSRAGEMLEIPAQFQRAAALITAAVSCVSCRHCHLLQPKA